VEFVEFFKTVDVGKGPETGIELPQLFHRDITGPDTPDHRAQGERHMALQVIRENGFPVNRVEGFEHFAVPAGDCRIVRADCIEEMADNVGLDARHIARRDKDEIPFCGKGTGMQAAYRPYSPPDIGDALYAGDVREPAALSGVAGDKDDLVNNGAERIDLPLDEGLPLVPEEIFLFAIGPPCLSPDKDHRRSH